jgi:hypothetical protein
VKDAGFDCANGLIVSMALIVQMAFWAVNDYQLGMHEIQPRFMGLPSNSGNTPYLHFRKAVQIRFH